MTVTDGVPVIVNSVRAAGVAAPGETAVVVAVVVADVDCDDRRLGHGYCCTSEAAEECRWKEDKHNKVNWV